MAKTRKFRIEQPYFNNKSKQLYPAGSIVEIPEGEKPSVTWEEIVEAPVAAEAPKAAVEAQKAKTVGRFSDKD